MPQFHKFICPFCYFSAPFLNLIGEDLSDLKEKQIIGAGLRSGGCFNCKSTDRERLIYIYVKEIIDIFNKDYKILHMAPEMNLAMSIHNSIDNENYICGDLSPEEYRYSQLTVNQIDLLNIPYPGQYFDLIICNHVLEHIEEDARAMGELYRVLKVGGKAILQVPISKNSFETFEDFSITSTSERRAAFGQANHVRIYGQDYVSRLENIGFKVNRVNISADYRFYGLNVEEDIFVCERI